MTRLITFWNGNRHLGGYVMLLNEFLEFKLGVVFEDKYNELAILEILNHQEKYPLIIDEIVSLINYDVNGEISNINIESAYFQCDDYEMNPSYEQTMSLYKAFVIAFWHDRKGKKYKIKSISFGLDFLRLPTTETILYPYLSYSGLSYITITPNEKEFVKKVFVSQIIEAEHIGHESIKTSSELFYKDNKKILNTIKNRIDEIGDIEDLFETRFCDEELRRQHLKIEAGVTGYAYDSFELVFDKNIIKFYATERGFDPLSLFRLPILDSLTDTEKKLEVVDIIMRRP